MKVITLTPSDDLQNIINSLKEPTTIHLKSGVYEQKVEITANNITLIGEGIDKTILTYADYANKIHADGKEYNTFRTYTLCITGDNIHLENLTVKNSNIDPATVGQCVALSVHGKDFYAQNIRLSSTQDTLFLSPFPDDLVTRYAGFIPHRQLYREGHLTHIFKNCTIEGTVDFIFGCAEAYFLNCDIVSLFDSRNVGYIAAPAHPLAEEFGFNFIDCNIKNGGAKEGEIFLARPWRDYGKCNFINCKLSSHISPLLFDKWNDTYRDKTARFGYYNLVAPFPLTPVPWSKELSLSKATNIITRSKEKLKQITKSF